MQDEEAKFNSEVAAMMRDHETTFKTLIANQISDCVNGIIASAPRDTAVREDHYVTIKALQTLNAAADNAVLYDKQRREAAKSSQS